MKEKLLQYKKPLMFAAIFAAVVFSYVTFFKKEKIGDLVIEAAPVTAATEDNRELLNQLKSLNAISLSSDIFNSTLFNTLQDNTVNIENRKPEGRRNPFLPIGVDNGAFSPDLSIQNAQTNTNGLLNSGGLATSTKVLAPNNIGALAAPSINKATTSSPKATSTPR